MIAPIDCAEARTALPLYLDDELGDDDRNAFERHLAACAACREAVAADRALKAAIRDLPRPGPPPALAARIRDQLPRPASVRRIRPWHAAAPALAAGLLLFLLGGVIGHWAIPAPPADAVGRDVVSAHMRALLGGHVTDVASAEGHTVKPWFNGRVEVAPPVVDLAGDGFPLSGGRLDYIDGRRAAAIVYRRRQHVISLFVWPSAAPPRGPAIVQGFNLEYWRSADMNYAAVSDLNGPELRRFAELFRTRTAAPAQTH